MILVFPLLLVAATFLTLRRAEERRAISVDARWRWFSAWSVAGAAMAFSLLAGLSIGFFVLPFAAALLLWVAWSAPQLRDALGFAVGIGAVLVLVAFLSRGGSGVDAMPWFLAGLSLGGLALITYSVLRLRP
jgi:hypothetical protein